MVQMVVVADSRCRLLLFVTMLCIESLDSFRGFVGTIQYPWHRTNFETE